METIKDTFCKNFKRFVEASSLSQKSIAAKVGVSEQTFYRWARGENTPGHENLEELGKVLGVSPFDFYQASNPGPVKVEPVSIFVRKIMSIPDKVYDYAEKFGPDHEVWETIKKAFELQELKDERKKQANKA